MVPTMKAIAKALGQQARAMSDIAAALHKLADAYGYSTARRITDE